MKILIDADACPVVDIAVKLCKEYALSCTLLCDTAHTMHRDGATTLIFDKGSDSVDFALANRVEPGDIVITQDYGLASMCLARQAQVIHQDGWLYTEYNIQALLWSRHETRKYRQSGGRVKGPSKRTAAQDQAFADSFRKLLQQSVQG